jgi:hypothetical protein
VTILGVRVTARQAIATAIGLPIVLWLIYAAGVTYLIAGGA